MLPHEPKRNGYSAACDYAEFDDIDHQHVGFVNIEFDVICNHRYERTHATPRMNPLQL